MALLCGSFPFGPSGYSLDPVYSVVKGHRGISPPTCKRTFRGVKVRAKLQTFLFSFKLLQIQSLKLYSSTRPFHYIETFPKSLPIFKNVVQNHENVVKHSPYLTILTPSECQIGAVCFTFLKFSTTFSWNHYTSESSSYKMRPSYAHLARMAASSAKSSFDSRK